MMECDVCGGPQVWTIHQGEVWVACQLDCHPPLHRLTPPPDSDEPEVLWRELFPQMELFEGEEVMPLEGGDANEH